MAATDAKKVKAMRTSVGCFSSPSFALIYQCSNYVTLHSSKCYAIPPLIQGLRHRHELPAVARRGAPRQGGG
eukprot:1266293-Pleurochrysis_carterae.AAC.1